MTTCDGVLDCRRHAARFRAVGRHDVARVANHEHVARFLLCDELRHEPAVGTRDKQRAWVLARGKLLVEYGALWERLAPKLEKSVNDILHGLAPSSVSEFDK